jgi:hypothetical protein
MSVEQQQQGEQQQLQQPVISYAYVNLIKDFRLLMTQLAYLTRSYMVSVFSGFGNAVATANRLYNLPNKFKEKAELIFGTPLSEEFLELLSLHVLYIQKLVEAMKNRDNDSANYYTQRLYQNAGDIAAYYAKINPFWDETQWKTLLDNYISLVIQEAVALGTGDYEKELDIFDRLIIAALAMGDYQAEGFIQYITAAHKHHFTQAWPFDL